MIVTKNEKKTVDISSDILNALHSTIILNLRNAAKKYNLVICFFREGKLDFTDGLEAARQINLIRDDLAKVSPEKAVYDMDNPKRVPPWKDNLSYTVTSCGNMFLTDDGKDLLFELCSIFTYGYYAKTEISII